MGLLDDGTAAFSSEGIRSFPFSLNFLGGEEGGLAFSSCSFPVKIDDRRRDMVACTVE